MSLHTCSRCFEDYNPMEGHVCRNDAPPKPAPSGPKEALERLIARLMPGPHNTTIGGMVEVRMTTDAAAEALADLETLAALIAEREGLEREVERLTGDVRQLKHALPDCHVCGGHGTIEHAAKTTGANQHSACVERCDNCDGLGVEL